MPEVAKIFNELIDKDRTKYYNVIEKFYHKRQKFSVEVNMKEIKRELYNKSKRKWIN